MENRSNFCILPQMRLALAALLAATSAAAAVPEKGEGTITLFGGARALVPGNSQYLTEQGASRPLEDFAPSAHLLGLFVDVEQHTVFAGEAKFALHADGRVETSCPDCGEPLALEIRAAKLDDDSPLFHCLVPAAHWWDDIVFT